MKERISLSEVASDASRLLKPGDSAKLDLEKIPSFSELAEALQFDLEDGRIWLNDERMVLARAGHLSDLRASLIEEIGPERARARLMKTGWDEGVHLSRLVNDRFKHKEPMARMATGPRIHTMMGFAKVVMRRFEFDVAKKRFIGEGYWEGGVEGAEHVRRFGTGDQPVCWTHCGVASGYTSSFLGFPIITRELECVAQGAKRCLAVLKDAESWEDDVEELGFFGFRPDKAKKRQPWTPASGTGKASKAVHPSDIVGKSTSFIRVRRLLEKVALVSEPVLLIGEAGTGKEHFARHLHEIGRLPDGPFVPVNCAALEPAIGPDDGVFGPGGPLDRADGGTLFLSDILALPPGHQAYLASYLQRTKSPNPPFRVLSSTEKQTLDAVMEGRFRTDLHYLLSVLPIEVPPLRERRDDLPHLINHFLELHKKAHRKPVEGLGGPVLDMLLRYDYPGNLRELSNMIERGVIYADKGGRIEISHVFTGIEKLPQIPGRVMPDGGVYRPMTHKEVRGNRTLQDIETEAILAALDLCDWNIAAAARRLGISRAKLDYRIQKLNLRPN